MLKKIALSAFALVMPLLVGEGIARHYSPKYSVFGGSPMMMPYSGGAFDTTRTLASMHENNDPNRAQKYVPDTNRWYRLDPEPTVPETGKLVFNFGDSSTWGWGLTDRLDAYPTALNKLLPEDVTSVNFGIPYYSSLLGLKYAQELVPRYADRIALVTLYFGNNDASENGSSDEAELRRISEITPVGWWLRYHCALYRLLLQWQANVRTARYNDVVRVSPGEYEANLRQMIELCKSYAIPVVLIEASTPLTWRPAHQGSWWHGAVDMAPYLRNPWALQEVTESKRLYELGIAQLVLAERTSTDTGYETLLHQAVEHDWAVLRIKDAWREKLRVLEREGVSVLRLPEAFALSEFPGAFEDYCHPSASRHEQIARQIAEALGLKQGP